MANTIHNIQVYVYMCVACSLQAYKALYTLHFQIMTHNFFAQCYSAFSATYLLLKKQNRKYGIMYTKFGRLNYCIIREHKDFLKIM